MKIIEYNLDTDKSIVDETIAIASNIHISRKTKQEDLDEILHVLSEINPTQIVIPGNLYNVDYDTIYSDGTTVNEFLRDASNITDVYYVQGKTELECMVLPYGSYNYSDLHLLCNTYIDQTINKKRPIVENVINIGKINIAGLKFSGNFYTKDRETKIKIILSKYQEYLEKISKECKTNTFNILLCCDPIIIHIHELLKNFDLVILGPEQIQPLFMHSSKYPFVKGIKQKDNTSYIISEGITKYHSETGILQPLERFHESTIEVVRVRNKK